MQTPIILTRQAKSYLQSLLDELKVYLDPDFHNQAKAQQITQKILQFKEEEPELYEKSLKYLGARRLKLLQFITEKDIRDADNII